MISNTNSYISASDPSITHQYTVSLFDIHPKSYKGVGVEFGSREKQHPYPYPFYHVSQWLQNLCDLQILAKNLDISYAVTIILIQSQTNTLLEKWNEVAKIWSSLQIWISYNKWLSRSSIIILRSGCKYLD